MTRMTIAAMMACGTLAMVAAAADDTQAAKQAAEAKNRAAHKPVTLSAPAGKTTADSPLVAAARATGRMTRKPGQVITNETLVREGGHFTTTAAQPPLAPMPKADPAAAAQAEADAKRQKAEAETARVKAKKEAEQRELAKARNAARYEGDAPDGEAAYQDPALGEGAIGKAKVGAPDNAQAQQPQAMKAEQPQTAQPQKPPL